MFKGPVGPQSGQTPRSIAEEKNSSAGFQSENDPPYDPTQGTPINKQIPRQAYHEAPLKPAGGGKPVEIATPFTIKGA
jgi:hypothetical protein